MARPTRSSPRSQDSGSSPQPPTPRSRKRMMVTADEESSTRPRRQRLSGASQGGSAAGTVEGGSGDAAGGSADSGAGAGSGSRRRSGAQRSSASQGDEEGGHVHMPLTESQGAARDKMIAAAKESTQEVQIEARDEKHANEIRVEERRNLIKKMMRFLLIKGLNQEPVTKREMMDTVLGQRYRGKRVLKYIVTKADQQLKDSVGFRIKTIAPEAEWHVKDTYYVINVLNNTQHSKEVLKGDGRAGRGLLMLILSVIQCTPDKVVREDHLFKKLHDHIDNRIPEKAWQDNASKTKIRVNIEGLGDLHDHLATFVKQHYLMKKVLTVPTADNSVESVPAYTRGARSVLEVGTHQLMELMAQVLDITVDPSDMLELEGESQDVRGLSQMATQDH